MTGYVLASLVFLGGVLIAVLGELINEEMRGWIDYLPRVILRLAATRLDPASKITMYEDEWLPELTCILSGAEARPISRVILGMKYSAGFLIKARRIASQPSPAGVVVSGASPSPAGRSPLEILDSMWVKVLAERADEISMRQAVIVAEIHKMRNELHCAEYLEAEAAPGSKARMDARYLRDCHQETLASLGEQLEAGNRKLFTLEAQRAAVMRCQLPPIATARAAIGPIRES